MKIEFTDKAAATIDCAFAGMFSSVSPVAPEIPLRDLHSFRSHPFKVMDDEGMAALTESVKEYGVLSPALARPSPDGGYELISGHRRKRACELAGLVSMPVIIRDMGDDEAAVRMVDANLQREHMLPSERAWAYRIKLEAMKRQGKRPESEETAGIKSRDILAEEAGVSKTSISQYIRLTQLLPSLMDAVDSKRISVSAGEALSYLSEDEQESQADVIASEKIYPSPNQAERLKGLCGGIGEHRLTRGMIRLILKETYKTKPVKVTLKEKTLSKYFKPGATGKEIESRIIMLLEEHGGG